jgi:hypothetical protein
MLGLTHDFNHCKGFAAETHSLVIAPPPGQQGTKKMNINIPSH